MAGRNKTEPTRQRNGKRVKAEDKIRETKKYINKEWKLGTWNIRSLQGKDKELEQEFEDTDLDILTITETKKKGQGSTTTDNEHVLIYSGVKENKRAEAGVGCIIHKRIAEQIHQWKAWTERILTVELRNKNKNRLTIIIVYGPNEDDSAINKDNFWQQLTVIMEEINGKIYIAGDFNARVGTKDEIYKEVIGKHGEKIRNNNGKRMLDFCILHNLLVTNTFYEHKDIHKYTRVVESRNEKSIIDYILIEKNNRSAVMDTKVRRGPEIGSDHYLLITKIREKNENKENTNTLKQENVIQYETIRSFKLTNKAIAKQYETEITRKIETETALRRNNVEEKWNYLKKIIIETTKEICGISRNNNKRKQTAWWTENIKQKIKIKKQCWKNYLNNKTTKNYESYKTARKQVKEIVINEKRNKWKEFGEKMERDSKGNQKLFYKTLKTLREDKKTDTKYIKDKTGEILKKDKEIMKRWREYFQELLVAKERVEENNEQCEITEDSNREYITLNELQETIRQLKNGKAAGYDKITGEMLKNMGEKGAEMLLEIYNKAWKEEQFPSDWEKALIVPIYKKGDNKDCNNYRGITLLCTAMKVLETIIDKKIRPILDNTLEESQSGFRKGRSAQDHIFTIKQIIEKRTQQQKKTYLAFIDLEKAFDRVPREKLWNILENRGVEHKTIRIIQKIYKNNKNKVISHNRSSEEFITCEGLRQGGGLSPLLFITFMDEIIKECSRTTKKLHVGYKNMQRVDISEGAFADDVVIVTENEKHLQKNLDIWNTTLNRNGMKMNKNKTKVMIIGNNAEEMKIQIESSNIEQVKTFKYLGIEIEENGNQEAEINNRIEKTLKLYYTMNKKFINKPEISRKTKINIFKTIYRPILTFGCESWVLNKQQKSKIQAVEMKYLRRTRGVTKKDKIRNTKIRDDLELESTLEFIEKRQLSWWGHLHRMDQRRPVKRIWEAKSQTRRRRGRPRLTWDGMIDDILKRKGTTRAEAKILTNDKKTWARFVHV